MENKIVEEVAKQLPVKEIYNDVGKPAAKSVGSLLGLIPRAINVALEPLHKWILNKEFNIERTKQLLEEKLCNVNPEDIVEPEAYVAVPAIQSLSYSMNDDNLRNLYANLLASAMNKNLKDFVHPSFTEVIKQLAPDEARVFNEIRKNEVYPVIWVRQNRKDRKGGTFIIRNFTTINEQADCNFPDRIPEYLENLDRLKLVNIYKTSYLTAEGVYNHVESMPAIKKLLNKEDEEYKYEIQRGFVEISIFGSSFSKVCCD